MVARAGLTANLEAVSRVTESTECSYRIAKPKAINLLYSEASLSLKLAKTREKTNKN